MKTIDIFIASYPNFVNSAVANQRIDEALASMPNPPVRNTIPVGFFYGEANSSIKEDFYLFGKTKEGCQDLPKYKEQWARVYIK